MWSLLASLAVSAATAPPRIFTEADAGDLHALCGAGDAAARGRIEARFDALIDERLASMRPQPGDTPAGKGGKPREKDGRGGNASDALLSAAIAWRLAPLLAAASEDARGALWPRLAESPALATALAFTYDAKADALPEVAKIAGGVVAADPRGAERHPSLVAAIAVVHDRADVALRVNENTATAPAPDLVWRYFTANAAQMRFGVDLAPELLVHVVDVPASPEEIAWAFKEFQGIKRVGDLYGRVKYDHDVLLGKAKKSGRAGWNLPNILRFGGICADQAYFTCAVAKALGIPAAYTAGRDDKTGHAWAGFVSDTGRTPWWDCEGRYDAYRGVTGWFRDPQTGRQTSDAAMPMLVAWGLEPEKDRVRAAALRTIDERLAARVKEGDESAADAAVRSAILLEAIRACPTDVRAWARVRELGRSGLLDEAKIAMWAKEIESLCGRQYPEVVYEVLAPMVAEVDDIERQHVMWIQLANALRHRGDLAGQALLRDAEMWEKAGEPEKAGESCEKILRAYPDGGPFVVQALEKAGKILRAQRDGARLVALHQATFNAITPPKELPGFFGRQSSWYRVGKAYVRVLADVGRQQEAAALDTKLERHLADAGGLGSTR